MGEFFEGKTMAYGNYFDWLRRHPVKQIGKYMERYELQTEWIVKERVKVEKKKKEEEREKEL